MKHYQKPETMIEMTPQCEEVFMASDPLSGDKQSFRDGLPIMGGALVDPSFNASSSFSRYSLWDEDAEEDIMSKSYVKGQ